MNALNPKVDLYLADGCGRCAYHATPKCKVKFWQVELQTLRRLMLDCGLTEDLKWSVPVYTKNGKNIFIVSAFKDFCSLNFIKGVLLKDPKNILQKQGESSQSARIIKFTDSETIAQLLPTLKEYIFESLELEESGQKVTFQKNLEPIPEELENAFDESQALKSAFYALTPGKQRGYIIYFSQPKQASTRADRIRKCTNKIMNGEALNDAYKTAKRA
jgi:uncharacterized protein YdeI (YjbR/CyaY-like superfamily)